MLRFPTVAALAELVEETAFAGAVGSEDAGHFAEDAAAFEPFSFARRLGAGIGGGESPVIERTRDILEIPAAQQANPEKPIRAQSHRFINQISQVGRVPEQDSAGVEDGIFAGHHIGDFAPAGRTEVGLPARPADVGKPFFGYT